MERIYFPQLPDRLFLGWHTLPAPKEGLTAPLGAIDLWLEMGGKATLLASGTVGSKDKCRAIYQGGRWWLLECRTAKGQALSADLKGALIGGAKAIPSVAIGASAGAELHIRKVPTDPAAFLTVEAVNVDVDQKAAPNHQFNRYIQSYVNWDKVNRQQDALACGFGHGWSPPGNHAGHGLLPRPYFTGDRGRDELRLVLGRGYKFEVYVPDPTQAAHWLDVLFIGNLQFRLSQMPHVDFLFGEHETVLDLRFPENGDISSIKFLQAPNPPIGRLVVGNHPETYLASARLNADWILLRFRGGGEARLDMRSGPGFSQHAADIIGATADFFALLPSIASKDRRLSFGFHQRQAVHRDPYSGLALTAIGDRAGGALRFDCASALLAIAAKGGASELVVGGDCLGRWPADAPMTPGWEIDERLRVKRDAANQRRAAIPVGETAFLELEDGPGATFPHGTVPTFELKMSQSPHRGHISLPVARLSAAPIDIFAEDKNGDYAYWSHKVTAPAEPFSLDGGRIDWPAPFFSNLEPEVGGDFRIADNAARHVDMEAIDKGTCLAPRPAGRIAYEEAAIQLRGGSAKRLEPVAAAPGKAEKVAVEKLILRRTLQNSSAFDPNEGIGRITYICSEQKLNKNLFHAEGRRLITDALGPQGGDLSTYEKIWIEVKSGFGLALLLKDGADQVFWFDRNVNHPHTPAMIIDFNRWPDAAGYEGAKFGFTKKQWDEIFQPIAHANQRLPNDSAFQGHVFRDFSFALPAVNPKILAFPGVRSFYESIERSVFVDLAWHDGKAWGLRARDRDAPYALWDNALVRLRIESFAFDMVAGETDGGHGHLTLTLPFLEDGKGKDALVDIKYSLAPGQEIMEFNRRRFDLSQDPEFQINFDYIEKFTVRDVDTDLASVTIRGDLLFKNVSFLKDPVKIKLQIPLTALAQEFEIEAQLPDTVEAKMDGWGLAITAMAFSFAASKRRKPSVAKLTLKGILNLGVDGFLAAHFTITIDDKGPVVTIDGYEAKLAIGDFSARLELEYDQQEFLGSLTLGSDLTGSFELAARVWQDNGETSWIAALQQGDIEADNFILKGPKLVLARRARIVGGAATLGDALLDPSSTTVAAAIAQRGLKHWEADPDADLVIGACGAFGLESDWFSPPAGEDKITGIVLGSGSFYRVSAVSNFLGFMPINYDLAIDTRTKLVFAGFQLPQFDPLGRQMRNGSKSNFQISSGYGGLGFSYAKERWQFAITVGWPYSSFLNPDVGAPDWSRSISVHWDGAFPLNTFMGGLSLYLSDDKKAFGLALRGGWTWGYKAKAWKLAAEAELGIMVGGVLHFTISRSLSPRAQSFAAALAARERDMDRLYSGFAAPVPGTVELGAALLKLGDDAFDALLGAADIGIRCGLFLDAWAHARVTFMGVTLLGVKIDARAQVYLGYDQGRIYSAYADAEFEVTVKIGCAEYTSKASFEVRFVDEDKPAVPLPAPWIKRPPLHLAAPEMSDA